MNLEEFIQEQLHERYKHFVIYGPALYGKTQLAKSIANDFEGLYVDLLKEFYEDPNKRDTIDIFGPQRLMVYIKRLPPGNKNVVVIDQLDFLLNTWDENQMREFFVFVDQNQSDVCFIFFMHNYRLLEKEDLVKVNDKGRPRLINMFNIKQGGSIVG